MLDKTTGTSVPEVKRWPLYTSYHSWMSPRPIS